MILKVCVLIFISFFAAHGDDVDANHFYAPGLRTGTLSCKSRLSHFYCQIKCDMKAALCIEDKCYCLNIVPAKEKSPEIEEESMPEESKKMKNKEIVEELVEDLIQPGIPTSIETKSFYGLRPTVRHHIAHFCPNLEAARTCIRKCMAKGKPAFCGKDHVCYCGHKYTHTGEEDGGDAKEIYAQFKDMYEKYFGPGYSKGSVEV